jgi:hypothetical protein
MKTLHREMWGFFIVVHRRIAVAAVTAPMGADYCGSEFRLEGNVSSDEYGGASRH